MDVYLERLKREGYIDSNGAATWELNWGLPPLGVENLDFGSPFAPDRDVPTTSNARNGAVPVECELNQELKKIKKYLKQQMIDLQKQANFMAAGFYCCIIALFFFYLLFISR